MTTYPKRFSHIGITVPDINKAAKFYSEVMGWYTIMPPSLVKKETDTAIGQMCIDVFGVISCSKSLSEVSIIISSSGDWLQ